MSHSNYTASERRGIIAIAVISLILIGVGVAYSIWNSERVEAEVRPMVEDRPELIDSVVLLKQRDESIKEDEIKSKKAAKKKNKASDKGKGGNKTSKKKTYPRRSPLDEPV